MSELDARLTALKDLILATYPDRVVTRSYREWPDIPDEDLALGVYEVLSRGVEGFQSYPGRMAAFGNQKCLVIGKIRLAESATGEQVEAAEFSMVDELLAIARGSLPEPLGGLDFKGFAQSSQTEIPYGWIAAEFEIGP